MISKTSKSKEGNHEEEKFFLTFVLSIIPGLGLIYLEKIVFGVIVMIVAFLGLLISLTGILAILGIPIFIFTEIIALFATVWSLLKYPGGWKWF